MLHPRVTEPVPPTSSSLLIVCDRRPCLRCRPSSTAVPANACAIPFPLSSDFDLNHLRSRVLYCTAAKIDIGCYVLILTSPICPLHLQVPATPLLPLTADLHAWLSSRVQDPHSLRIVPGRAFRGPEQAANARAEDLLYVWLDVCFRAASAAPITFAHKLAVSGTL